MARFLCVFLLVLLGLFLAELTPPVQRLVIVPWTAFLASASGFILRLVDSNVLAHGNVLQDIPSGSGITIEAGCNAVEACIMLAAEVNGLVYAYGAPLLAALLLASRPAHWWWKLPAGLLALLPFQAWGICFTWLLQVAVVAGEQTRSQTRFGPWEANLVAAGYQLGFLILPTLVPVLLWLAFDRRVLAGAMIEGALAADGR